VKWKKKELEEQFEKNEAEYKKNIDEYNLTVQKINGIKDAIEEIFNLVNNETSQKYRALSSQQGITHENIMQYLGLVEEMINGMI